MAPAVTQSHARSHALLLLQKLLNLRDNASPLTLVLDTLEQSGKPIIREFLLRAKIAKSKTIFVSFETLRKPACVDVLVKARGKSPEALCAEIVSHYKPSSTGTTGPSQQQKILIIIDTLNPLSSTHASSLPSILGSLLTQPTISIVALYHSDIPLSPSQPSDSDYSPSPLSLLTHLATSLLTVSSLHQSLERKKARDRSLQEPEWGINEGKEGVIIGLRPRRHPGATGGSGSKPSSVPGSGTTTPVSSSGAAGAAAAAAAAINEAELRSSRQGGLILDMELRRRSGRSVGEKFVFLPAPAGSVSTSTSTSTSTTVLPPSFASGAARLDKNLLSSTGKIMLLADHPLFRSQDPMGDDNGGAGEGEEQPESTFNLGLTDKQRQDREGIVLPYFDAQTDIGAGEGGRILYEMGREDDFDDEEDEI